MQSGEMQADGLPGDSDGGKSVPLSAGRFLAAQRGPLGLGTKSTFHLSIILFRFH